MLIPVRPAVALLIVLTAIFSLQANADQVALRAFEHLSTDLDASVDDRKRGEAEIRAFGRNWTLVLAPNRALLSLLNERAKRSVEADNNLFLSGRVVGVEGSWARLSRVAGRWSGGFFDGRELYLIDQAAGLRLPEGRAVESDRLLVYRFSDLDLRPILLHEPISFYDKSSNRQTGDYRQFVSHLRELTVLEGEAPLLLPITVVTDTQFNDRFGVDTAAVVASRTNFIDGLYSAQLGTGIQLFHHEPLVSDGSLTATDAGDLLVQFRSFMRSGSGSNIPFAGLGHLFTARSRDGGIAGIAYLGVLCNERFGYGVNWNLNNETTNGLVFAHEVGHNFNAPHDGEGACSNETFRGIMNPSINGSQQFSDCSLVEMSEEVGGAGCLVENPFLEDLFSDGFELN